LTRACTRISHPRHCESADGICDRRRGAVLRDALLIAE
jgi:hypothetical protein